MHIIYVLTKLELGGAQKICLSLHKKFSSSLISGAEGTLVPEIKNSKNIYLLKSFKREVGIKNVFLEFAAFVKMITLMKKIKKQHQNVAVHTHSTKAGIVGRWAAFFARIKTRIHTVHGFGFHEHQSKIGWYIHFIFEYVTSLITTHYICVSQADKKTGAKFFPQFKRKSSIIRAAVDWDRFYTPTTKEKKIREKEAIVFGSISCLKPQKNLIDLLKAFKHMHDNLPSSEKKSVRLQIIGDGIERAKLERWIDQENFSKQIDLLGWQKNVAEWMESWDVFMMSSLWEGLPCAIVEARLKKLPVISYKIAGIPEVIKNDKNGFLIPAGDWKKLGDSMLKLANNKPLLEAMGSHNEDLVDFKNETMLEKHNNLYKRFS